MQIKELGHVVLFVRDLAKSVHFYRDVLGFQPVEGQDKLEGGFVFSSGRTHHEMLLIEVGLNAAPPQKGRRAGLYHIGLKIGDSIEELKAAKAELEQEGVKIVGMSDHHVTKSLYILDPDGNEIELYTDVDPALWKADPSLIMAPTMPLYI